MFRSNSIEQQGEGGTHGQADRRQTPPPPPPPPTTTFHFPASHLHTWPASPSSVGRADDGRCGRAHTHTVPRRARSPAIYHPWVATVAACAACAACAAFVGCVVRKRARLAVVGCCFSFFRFRLGAAVSGPGGFFFFFFFFFLLCCFQAASPHNRNDAQIHPCHDYSCFCVPLRLVRVRDRAPSFEPQVSPLGL